MVTIQLPPDFKEFFTLLNLEKTEYLLVGGYAVIHYGYVRSTGDMVISLDELKANKRSTGRAKDQADLDNLP